MKFGTCMPLLVLAAVFVFITEIDGQRGGRLSRAEKQQRRRDRRLRNRTSRPPVTSQRPCPPIPHVTNGQGLDAGNTVQYACEPGFRLEGTNVITCLDGRWTVAPRCRRQVCPNPTNAVNANAPQLSADGASATYTCLPGFEIVNGNGQTSITVNCNVAIQFWPVPSCTQRAQQSCGAPPVISNAQTTLSATGTSATYTCVTGYTLRAGTQNMLQCTNSVWPTTNLPVCDIDTVNPVTPQKCLKAPPCGDEKVVREDVTDSYEIGGKVKYTCVSGYRIVGGNDNSNMTGHAYCLNSGTWSVTPTCEKKNCGKPDEGTNTNTVVATGTMFGDTYNYTCNTNYETGMLISATCMADGKWSIPAPTCTQKKCKAAAFPTIGNANYAPADTVVGGEITVTCQIQYRLAPVANPTVANLPTAYTLKCEADGNFTNPTQHCVYQHPENCTDYFRRDDPAFFSGHLPSCDSVTIDPQGPALSTVTTNPRAVTVQCCKSSAGNQVCTQVVPTVTQPTFPITCDSTGLSIVPDAAADNINSHFCNLIGTVTYPLMQTEIQSMVQSTCGTCTQQTRISCTAAEDLTPIIKARGEIAGILYGAGAFTQDPTDATGSADFDEYAIAPLKYLGDCDCALSSTTTCATGCNCVDNAAGQTTSDTITREITSRSLAYVESFGYARHDSDTSAVAATEMPIEVDPIVCCENFVA